MHVLFRVRSAKNHDGNESGRLGGRHRGHAAADGDPSLCQGRLFESQVLGSLAQMEQKEKSVWFCDGKSGMIAAGLSDSPDAGVKMTSIKNG